MMDDDKDAWLDEVKQWVFGNQLPAHMRPAPARTRRGPPAAAGACLAPPRGKTIARAGLKKCPCQPSPTRHGPRTDGRPPVSL
jgi:hypothetical protein